MHSGTARSTRCIGPAAVLIGVFTLAGCQSSVDQMDRSTKMTTESQRAELIDSLWDFRDAEGSARRFRDAASETSDELLRLRLLTQLARAQGLQRKFEEAHATLDVVDRVIRKQPQSGMYGSVLPLYAIERGRVFNSSGDRDRARTLFQEAWEAASAAGQEALAVDAAHMMAIVSSGDDAIRWNQLALERAESSADERARRWRASLHNNLGWAHHELGEYDKALDHFEHALRAREERGQIREILIARWSVARCLRSLGRVQEALDNQQELVAEWERLGEPDGYVFEEIGECLLLLDRPEEACSHFARAYELLRGDPWLSTSEPLRLERLARLGGVDVD